MRALSPSSNVARILQLLPARKHVIQRGNDQQACFFTEIDRTHYLQDLRQIARREACHVHVYVLMTNHVHLLLTPSAAGQVGRVMQSLPSAVKAECSAFDS